jgi:hypothetical protein
MTVACGLDDLMRAAEAAGFAMAAPDDDPLQASTAVPISAIVSPTVSVEDLARGAHRPVTPEQTGVTTTAAAGSMVPKSVRTGANSMRETVYGYLGFGVPA